MAQKVSLPITRTELESEKRWVEHGRVRANPKDVVLMDALSNLALPECATPQFVRIAAFGQKNVAAFQSAGAYLIFRRLGFLHFTQVQPTVFDIGHAEIRNTTGRTATQVTT